MTSGKPGSRRLDLLRHLQMQPLVPRELVRPVAGADGHGQAVAARLPDEDLGLGRVGEMGVLLIHLHVLLHPAQLSQLGFHGDAPGMRGVHHLPGDADVLFERLAGGVDHHRGVEAALDADSVKLDHLSAGAVHQGVVAMAAAKAYATVDDLFALAESRGEQPFLILADGLEDPHNLGAILRVAECAGAHGIIIPKRRSVGLTVSVGKASAGAVEYVPVARVTNLADTIDELKKRGVWVYAADMSGQNWCETDFSGPAAVVIGSEGFGVSRLIREKADVVISLPMMGKINSLNASVACGIVCYEIVRQRKGIHAK